MKIKGIIFEDFVNYKEPSMTIEFPYCDFKCDKIWGRQICQNSELASSPTIEVPITRIVKLYMNNNITKAIVFQGLEPFDSKDDLYQLIKVFREYTNDNIIIKFGRFFPDQPHHYDKVLGVTLASSNQYAKKIC